MPPGLNGRTGTAVLASAAAAIAGFAVLIASDIQMLRDFGRDVNLANIAPGQILRLEGFRRGIGRAVNYSLLSGDDSRASRPAILRSRPSIAASSPK